MLVAPDLLRCSVLFAPVVLRLDRAIFDVVDHRPAPGAMGVQPDDAPAVFLGAARFGVWRLKFVQRGANLLDSQPDFFGYGARVYVNVPHFVSVGKKVSKH